MSPKFSYEAKQGPGKTVHGVIEAQSRSDCTIKLTQRGFFPITVVETKGTAAKGLQRFVKGRVSIRDLEGFTRQLSSLLESGLALSRALEVLEKQKHKPALARVVTGLAECIRDGKPLSEGMARFPQVFSDMYVNMVRSGETGGNLEMILTRLADFSERQDELGTRIRTAMAYPILMAVVGTVTICVLLTFVVPTIAGMFADLGQALPLPTRMLIETSRFLGTYGGGIFIAAAFLVVLMRRALKRREARVALDRIWLKLPLFGELIVKTNLTHLTRTLSTLLQSGVPILVSLKVAARTITSELVRREFTSVTDEVSAGSSLAGAMKKRLLFPSFVTNLIAVGEEGGQLELALSRIAESYDRDARRAVGVLTSLLEPGMILVMGSIVGFIVVSMLLPIFELNVLIR